MAMDPKMVALLKALRGTDVVGLPWLIDEKDKKDVKGTPWKTEGKAPVTPVTRMNLPGVRRPVVPVTQEELGNLPTRPRGMGPPPRGRLAGAGQPAPTPGPAAAAGPSSAAVAEVLNNRGARPGAAPQAAPPGWLRARGGRLVNRAPVNNPAAGGVMAGQAAGSAPAQMAAPGFAGPLGLQLSNPLAGQTLPPSGYGTGQSVIDQSNTTASPPGVGQYTDDPLINAVIQAESAGRPNAVSPKGAIGMMQIMPETARQPGYGVEPLQDPYNPQENVRFGGDYLGAMIEKFGGLREGLIAFNMGPGATMRWIQNGKNEQELPQSVRAYLQQMRQYIPASMAGAF
jgi:soluble lytic murein transglycosylase-like protein